MSTINSSPSPHHRWLAAVAADLEATDLADPAVLSWGPGPARLFVVCGEQSPWLARSSDDVYELIGPAVALLAVDTIDAAIFLSTGTARSADHLRTRVRVAFGFSRRATVGVVRVQSSADDPMIDFDPVGGFPDAVEQAIRCLPTG